MNDHEIAAQVVRRLGAQQRLIRAVEAFKDPRRRLNGLNEALDDVELAARDLTNVIDDLPARDRPEGWETSPDARTA